ncbi:hypothetical protein HF086_014683 [Spodoptera exigua]|uniref:NADPH--hemoprotein reductase n=1 Tax=Spodoptera exigua TaxID=7107 RepID=A0A922SBJ2_SPOEX|nr:hypothetical protein HF086_014683 [Spodoptera exigua]
MKMVALSAFEDIIADLQEIEKLSLPEFKQTPLKVCYTNDNNTETTYDGSGPPLPFAASKIFDADILTWKRLTAANEDCKAVYEITLDVEDSNLTFKAGDTVGIIPQNDDSDIGFIVNHLNLASTVDLPYSIIIESNIKGSKLPIHIPVKSTLRHVLRYCVELRSLLKKAFLLSLSRYTKDDEERKILEYLCSKEGSAAYTNHVLNKRLCILDIFKNLEKPLILIGPGTGVSPFIGFLEEREFLKETNQDIQFGDVYLYFGCRNPKLDFIYEEQLNKYLEKGTLNKLFTAFSRVNSEKKYIQEVVQLIKEGAHVYICGDLNTMAVEVKEILINCLVEYGDMTLEEAKAKISYMQKQHQYVVDAWS